MQKYRHDYTNPSVVDYLLYRATRLIATECYDEARVRINEARHILQEYLASDNMVPDDDIAFGWYRAEEVDHKL